MMILHTFDNTYSDGTTYRQFLQTTDDPLEALQLAPPDSDREDLESFLWDLFEQSRSACGEFEDEEIRKRHEQRTREAADLLLAHNIQGFLQLCEDDHVAEEEVANVCLTIYGEWVHDSLDLNLLAGNKNDDSH